MILQAAQPYICHTWLAEKNQYYEAVKGYNECSILPTLLMT